MKTRINYLKYLILIFSAGYFFQSCEKNDDIIVENLGYKDKGDKKADSINKTLNVLDFGADNTGTHDSSPAFDELLAAMGDYRQIDIYIPPGQYKISKRIVIDQSNLSGYQESHGLRFRGAGEDVTEIICDNDEGGFYFNVGTNQITVTLEDLSFVALRAGQGTAVEYNTNNQNPGDHHSRMFQVQNVLVRGTKFNEGYFENGVLIYNAWYPLVDNVKITTRYGKNAQESGNRMGHGFLFQDCYSPLITNSYFWGNAEYGLQYKAVEKNPEDGIVKDCYFVGQDHGIYVDLKEFPKWSEPAFHISNSHINYEINGVFLKGVRQVFIDNNLFYCRNHAGSKWRNNTDPVSEYESRDVNLNYSTDVVISNNIFTQPASPKRIAVDISERSGGILIEGNIFNFDATAIRNNSGKTSTATGNVFGGYPNFSAELVPYVDNTGTLNHD